MSHSYKDYKKLKEQGQLPSVPSTPKITVTTPVPSQKQLKPISAWPDLETVMKNYEDSHILPPLLKPELPKKYEQLAHEKTQTPKEDMNIPRLLSPTLPHKYDGLRTQPSQLNLDLDGDSPSSSEREERSYDKTERHGNHRIRRLKTPDRDVLDVTLRIKKEVKHVGLGIHERKRMESPYRSDGEVKKRKISSDGERRKETRSPERLRTSDSEKRSFSNKSSERTKLEVKTVPKTTAKREVKILTTEQMLKLKAEYLQLAIEKKHRGDVLLDKDFKLGLAYFVDCIVLYLVGFTYEDKIRRHQKKLYNDAPWLSLISFIDSVLELTKNREFEDIAGLCFQIRTVVYEHVGDIVLEFMRLGQLKRKRLTAMEDIKKLDEKLSVNLNDLSKYKALSRKGLIDSEEKLSIFQLQLKYPDVVQQYLDQSPQKENNEADLAEMDPVTDEMQLPINHRVTIKQVASYTLKLIKAWTKNEGVKYDKWSF